MSEAPFVSVVVPTADRADVLGDCLESLLAQDYPSSRYEVIVVHNGPGTARPALVEPLLARAEPPALRLIRLPVPDANAARNAGMAAAGGDPICLIDDDVVVPIHWLSAMVAGAARHPSAGCLGGPVRPRFEREPPRTCSEHGLAGAVLDEGPEDAEVGEVWSCNMAVRRHDLERVGPLRERLAVLHECEWQGRLHQAGGRIVYLPAAWIWHRRLESDLRAPALVRDNFLLGYAVVALGQELTLREAAAGVVSALAHAARRRCTRGFTDAMRKTGSACAIIAGRRRRPWATSLR